MADLPAGLPEALHVTAPDPALARDLDLFGRFVGSWRLDWTGAGPDGRRVHALGELHFGWVLGGRAVQDTWIVPGRGRPGSGRPPLAFHGTTVRFYDPRLGAWRSTWIDPVNGRVRRFVGRPAGDDILLLSDDEPTWLRWRFSEITPTSFRWRGERSDDAGATWSPEDEMRATRADG